MKQPIKSWIKRTLGPKGFARVKKVIDVLLPHWRGGYSQFGEDRFLAEYFKNTARGQYVDVGAFHPRQFSNTYWLYRRGWSGINLDATPGSMELFRLLRPRDHNVECAITADGREITFANWGTNSENTARPEQIQGVAAEKGQPMSLTRLPSRTLTEVLRAHAGLRPDFELLSVDVEGMDLEVLQSLDWTAYHPRLVIAEQFGKSIDEVLSSEVYRFLRERGYRLIAWYNPSLIFERQK